MIFKYFHYSRYSYLFFRNILFSLTSLGMKLLFIHSKISFYKQRIVGQKHVLFMFKQRKGRMILVDNNILLLILLPHLRQLHRRVVERIFLVCVNL